MLIVGLTGSIGMGKSTAAKHLRSLGIPVFDADATVHALYAGAAVKPVEQAFPGTTRNGVVDRQALALALGGKSEAFRRLEAIVHPLVRAEQTVFLRAAHSDNSRFAVLEVPLLFETGLDGRVDVVILVSAPADVQRSRVLARPGMTEEKFSHILSQQMDDSEKRRRADFVVDTVGSIEASIAQLDTVLAELPAREGGAFASHWQK
ncbi:MAG: dephospho-CoA kinase [Pseudomonadota bacterium]